MPIRRSYGLSRGRYPSRSRGAYPRRSRGAYPARSRGAYPARSRGSYPRYARGAYPGRARIRRRGGYLGDMGEKYGAKLGGWLGRLGGNTASRITGFGSYNEAQNGMLAPIPPTFNTRGDYDEICHREYIGDIYSSSSANTLSIQSFYVNPSDTLCFPWMSQIAATSYQQYKLAGCIFEFKSFSADALNSTNTALGTVVAAVTYDSTDNVPTNRAQLENTDWSQAYKPSQSFSIPLECKDSETLMQGLLNTRQSNSIPTGTDRRLYDLARLDIASLGIQGTSVNLGSLYVTYKVRLYKKVQYVPAVLNGFAIWANATGVAASTPFGTAADLLGYGNTMNSVVTATTFTIPQASCIPGAIYNLIMWWKGSSASCVPPAISNITGGSSFSMFSSNASSVDTSNINASGSTATTIVMCYAFQIASTVTAPLVITLGTSGTLPTSSPIVNIYCTQVNAALAGGL